MKRFNLIPILTGCGLVLLAEPVLAQTNAVGSVPPPAGTVTPPVVRPPAGQTAIPNRPVVIPPPAVVEYPNLPARPERPAVPGRPVPTPDMKDLIKNFQSARQVYLNDRKELLRQLKNATDEQRAAIREQLKENLREWLEQQKALQREMVQQAKEMKDRLKDLGPVINPGNDGPRP